MEIITINSFTFYDLIAIIISFQLIIIIIISLFIIIMKLLFILKETI